MSKAQAKIVDSIFLVIATVSFVATMYLFITQSFSELAKQMASDSSEVVSKDIGGFITVSAAAPDDITITYQPSTIFTYDITVNDNGIVKASSLLNGKPADGPRFFGMGIPAVWMDKTAIGGIDTTLSDVKIIEIEKSTSNGEYVFKIFKKG